MPRPLLYLDECVDQGVAPLIAGRGFDITTARDAGIVRASDDVQLAYATAHDWLLISHNNLDFRRLHRQSMQHAGILIVPTGKRRLLALRIALAADWIATLPDYRGQFFRWNHVQQWLIRGERIAGYTEADVHHALGHEPRL
jgi:hypothetical protein